MKTWAKMYVIFNFYCSKSCVVHTDYGSAVVQLQFVFGSELRVATNVHRANQQFEHIFNRSCWFSTDKSKRPQKKKQIFVGLWQSQLSCKDTIFSQQWKLCLILRRSIHRDASENPQWYYQRYNLPSQKYLCIVWIPKRVRSWICSLIVKSEHSQLAGPLQLIITDRYICHFKSQHHFHAVINVLNRKRPCKLSRQVTFKVHSLMDIRSEYQYLPGWSVQLHYTGQCCL